MEKIEFLVGFLAAMSFVWLTYRLLLIVFSTPIALARVQRSIDVLRSIETAISRTDTTRRGANSKLLKTFANKATQRENPADMLNEVINIGRSNPQLAHDRVSCWLLGIAGDWQHHWSLANHATSTGMLFTVAGGLFAFAHIGGSENPFAAFGSLALAMLTTIGGLLISMAVQAVLDRYSRRLALLEAVTNEVVSLLLKTGLTSKPRRRSQVERSTTPRSKKKHKRFKEPRIKQTNDSVERNGRLESFPAQGSSNE